jgi:hypothetical protein
MSFRSTTFTTPVSVSQAMAAADLDWEAVFEDNRR